MMDYSVAVLDGEARNSKGCNGEQSTRNDPKSWEPKETRINAMLLSLRVLP